MPTRVRKFRDLSARQRRAMRRAARGGLTGAELGAVVKAVGPYGTHTVNGLVKRGIMVRYRNYNDPDLRNFVALTNYGYTFLTRNDA